jgi:hypothetical protein
LSGEFIVDGTDTFRQTGSRVQQAADLGVPKPELMVRAYGAAILPRSPGLRVGSGSSRRPLASRNQAGDHTSKRQDHAYVMTM